MKADTRKLRTMLAGIAGAKPSYVERSDGGFVAFFESELSTLRVAYAYREQSVVCDYRPTLGVWSVTVRPRSA